MGFAPADGPGLDARAPAPVPAPVPVVFDAAAPALATRAGATQAAAGAEITTVGVDPLRARDTVATAVPALSDSASPHIDPERSDQLASERTSDVFASIGTLRVCLIADQAELRRPLRRALRPLIAQLHVTASVEQALALFAAGMVDHLVLARPRDDGRARVVMDRIGSAPAGRLVVVSDDPAFDAIPGVRRCCSPTDNIGDIARAVVLAFDQAAAP